MQSSSLGDFLIGFLGTYLVGAALMALSGALANFAMPLLILLIFAGMLAGVLARRHFITLGILFAIIAAPLLAFGLCFMLWSRPPG